jgi:hypothetical protein
MDFEKITVIRDREHKHSFVTLPDHRKIRITDNGQEDEVESIPAAEPDFPPTKNRKVFTIKPWPYSGIDVPPLSVLQRFESLFAKAIEQKGP